MENYEILVTQTFNKDLNEIVYYISHNFDEPFTATKLLDDVESTVSSLSSMPYRNRLAYDLYLKSKEFRKSIIKNYIIFYKIYEYNKTVILHRILHARQNWIDIL